MNEQPGSFASLLEVQRELQDFLLERTGRAPTTTEIELALRQEIAELGQLLKAEWVWWPMTGRKLKEPSRGEILEEIADVLHFTLLLALATGRPVDPPGYLPPGDIASTLVELYRQARPSGIVMRLVALATHYGILPDEIVEAYLIKVEKNKKRWAKK